MVGMRSQGNPRSLSSRRNPVRKASFGPRAAKYAANRLITLPGGPARKPTKSSPPPTRLSPRPLNSTPTIGPDQSGSIKLRLADSQPRPIRSLA